MGGGAGDEAENAAAAGGVPVRRPHGPVLGGGGDIPHGPKSPLGFVPVAGALLFAGAGWAGDAQAAGPVRGAVWSLPGSQPGALRLLPGAWL